MKALKKLSVFALGLNLVFAALVALGTTTTVSVNDAYAQTTTTAQRTSTASSISPVRWWWPRSVRYFDLEYLETNGTPSGLVQTLTVQQEKKAYCCGSGCDPANTICCSPYASSRLRSHLIYADAEFAAGNNLDVHGECLIDGGLTSVDPLFNGSEWHGLMAQPYYYRWDMLNLANVPDGSTIEFEAEGCEPDCNNPTQFNEFVSTPDPVEALILLEGQNVQAMFTKKGHPNPAAAEAALLANLATSPYAPYISIDGNGDLQFLVSLNQFLVLYEIDRAGTGNMGDPEYLFDDGVLWKFTYCGEIRDVTPPPAQYVEVRDDIGCDDNTGVCTNPGLTDGGYSYIGNLDTVGTPTIFPAARVDFSQNVTMENVKVVFAKPTSLGGPDLDPLYVVRVWTDESDVVSDPHCQNPNLCSWFNFTAPSSTPEVVGNSTIGIFQVPTTQYALEFDLLNANAQGGNISMAFTNGSRAYVTVVSAGGSVGTVNVSESSAPNSPSDIAIEPDGAGGQLLLYTVNLQGSVPPFQVYTGRLGYRIAGTTF